MPRDPIQYVPRVFVPDQFRPDSHTLQAMLERQGALQAQAALNAGAGRASMWNQFGQLFGQYQNELARRDQQAAAVAQRRSELAAADKLKRDEMAEKKAEREDARKRQEATDARLNRSELRAEAADLLPGVVPSEMANKFKPTGRIQILDGVPVLMRTAPQQQAADALAATVAERKAAGERAAVDDARMNAALAETARHNAAIEAKQARPLAREVVQGPNGPLLVDKETGKTAPIMGPDNQPLKTAQSAAERMDSRKFQKSAPVLKAIGELSERINVNNGLYAKLAGGAEKLKAKANLDDDVAEYEALVSGFTPLIARSLGHTGVLTQQDVDSVKAIFPRPGDSKTLRDRKVNRLLGIVSELEQTEGVGNVAPAQKKNPFR